MGKTKATRPEGEDPAADSLPEFDDLEAETTNEGFADPEGAKGKAVLQESQGTPDEPGVDSPEWTPFVLSQLTPDEKHENAPRLKGLRRMVSALLGDIIENTSHVVQAPSPANGRTAVVLSRVVILWSRDVDVAQERVFTGAGDVYPGNATPEFARYATALAETRAEARALRKALQLGVAAAEEMTEQPVEEAGLDGKSTPTQHNFIIIKCQQLGIDVMKFINHGKAKFRSLKDIPYDTANAMTGLLSEYQQDVSRVPAGVKGYNPDNWKS